MSLLCLDNIEVSFFDKTGKKETLLQDFSFTMEEGEFVVVLGGSGGGKTTLLNVISGLLRPTGISQTRAGRLYRWLSDSRDDRKSVKGRVLIEGKDVSDKSPMERNVGLVMQRFNLYPHMTVRKNLEFPLKMKRIFSKKDRRKQAENLAKKLQIPSDYLDKKPSELSGGEQQRIAIGKMLIRNPRIALFDEAFSNLDWELRRDLFRDVIQPLMKDKNGECERPGVIFVTHILDDAKNATKIIYMAKNNSKVETFTGTVSNPYDEFMRFLKKTGDQEPENTQPNEV